MLDILVGAIRERFRVTIVVIGHQDRVLFEPHMIYTDPIGQRNVLAGNQCGLEAKPSTSRVWTEIDISTIQDIISSGDEFFVDLEFEEHRNRVFGTISVAVE